MPIRKAISCIHYKSESNGFVEVSLKSRGLPRKMPILLNLLKECDTHIVPSVAATSPCRWLLLACRRFLPVSFLLFSSECAAATFVTGTSTSCVPSIKPLRVRRAGVRRPCSGTFVVRAAKLHRTIECGFGSFWLLSFLFQQNTYDDISRFCCLLTEVWKHVKMDCYVCFN